jgi:NADP-dependent 3-hydroxy acid dehydrogenase YdfG
MIAGAVGNLGQAVAGALRAGGAKLALIDRTPDRPPSA